MNTGMTHAPREDDDRPVLRSHSTMRRDVVIRLRAGVLRAIGVGAGPGSVVTNVSGAASTRPVYELATAPAKGLRCG